MLPHDTNGRRLADEFRARYPNGKVLFTSGYTENAIVHHGRLDDDVEFLGKPYTRETLGAAVRRVLDRDDAG